MPPDVSVLSFQIPPLSGPKVWDISKIVLFTKVKLTKKDKTSVPEEDLAASVCDNILFSLFKSLKISFNGVPVCNIPNLPVYSYIKTLMNADHVDYDTHLKTCRGTIKDDPDHFETCGASSKYFEAYFYGYVSKIILFR